MDRVIDDYGLKTVAGTKSKLGVDVYASETSKNRPSQVLPHLLYVDTDRAFRYLIPKSQFVPLDRTRDEERVFYFYEGRPVTVPQGEVFDGSSDKDVIRRVLGYKFNIETASTASEALERIEDPEKPPLDFVLLSALMEGFTPRDKKRLEKEYGIAPPNPVVGILDYMLHQEKIGSTYVGVVLDPFDNGKWLEAWQNSRKHSLDLLIFKPFNETLLNLQFSRYNQKPF